MGITIKNICCIVSGYVGGPTMTVMSDKCPDLNFNVVDINKNRIGLWNNNNDYQNKVIDTSKSRLEGNVKKKNNNYKNNKKRKKEEINKAQQKREERLRMELYNDNVISDEHVDLLLSSSTNTDDNGGGGNNLKKRMRKKNKCGRW